MEELKFHLKKNDTYEPWGFGIVGGADFSFPVKIVKLKINGEAAKCGLRANDVITKVNEESINDLKSKEVTNKILDSGNVLELTVRRFPELKF
ncbi:PREDICTED: PDZ and LIM domain protein 2-like [Polistes dominula]|uniref:PDZ and LIM domain protein 2-like n=1 Tax=Polistes dominula TaxID=743375 RepID=A0ABM1IUP2_POLDO|nr:PREDICTED: PDZ and LIM domain protein 2-like [Polistes dominula]